VLGGAEQRLDKQVLLDRLEEPFELSATPIPLGMAECWQGELIGYENEPFVSVQIAIFDAHAMRVGTQL
jgi:hypothetical protein